MHVLSAAGERLHEWTAHEPKAVCTSLCAVGDAMWSAGSDGLVRVWNAQVRTGRMVSELGGHDGTGKAHARVRWCRCGSDLCGSSGVSQPIGCRHAAAGDSVHGARVEHLCGATHQRLVRQGTASDG